MLSSVQRRSLAWSISACAHAALLVAFLALRHAAIPPTQPQPEPLVFVEPAPPPPPLATGYGGDSAQPVIEAVDNVARQPAILQESVAQPTPKPTRPAKPKPTPSAVAASKPAAAAPASTLVGEGTSDGVKDGKPGGVVGGVIGGIDGGVVGGHGDKVVGADVAAQPPAVLSRKVPEYPAEAREQRLEGSVLLQAIVDREGRVEDPVIVLRSLPPFDAAAIAALRQWRFTPGRDHNNQPVRVRIEVPMRFQLR